MYTLQLNTSRIHPNSKKRDRNLSPSKVVTFIYWYAGVSSVLKRTVLTPAIKYARVFFSI